MNDAGKTHWVGDGCDPPHRWPSRWIEEEGRPNLDEIRRDLFHAEGDKVCTGRLIRRHVPALLVEMDRLIEENHQLRREAVGVTEDGRTVTDLEGEVGRIRDVVAVVRQPCDCRLSMRAGEGHREVCEVGFALMLYDAEVRRKMPDTELASRINHRAEETA